MSILLTFFNPLSLITHLSFAPFNTVINAGLSVTVPILFFILSISSQLIPHFFSFVILPVSSILSYTFHLTIDASVLNFSSGK
jgi:hypothetical protein